MPQVLEAIKQKELHVGHLRVLLTEAKQANSPEVFLINRELIAQQERGKVLLDMYNQRVQEMKLDREMVARFQEREMARLRRGMLNEIISRYRYDLPSPSKIW